MRLLLQPASHRHLCLPCCLVAGCCCRPLTTTHTTAWARLTALPPLLCSLAPLPPPTTHSLSADVWVDSLGRRLKAEGGESAPRVGLQRKPSASRTVSIVGPLNSASQRRSQPPHRLTFFAAVPPIRIPSRDSPLSGRLSGGRGPAPAG